MISHTNSNIPLQKPICIVGPTGIGKSDLAQELALSIDAEILSCDSMQIYKEMDIGTGKVTLPHQKVKHWGIDIADPGEAYSVSRFQEYGRKVLEDCAYRNKRVILCGGTGFWVRSIIDDYQFPKGEQINNETRMKWNLYAELNGHEALWNELHKIDPESAALIPPKNVKRVVRAFEMLDEGIHYSDQVENLKHIPEVYPAVWIGLNTTREVLYDRINKRVDLMIQSGLIDEVTSLCKKGFREALTAPQAIGYKEIVNVIEGSLSLNEATEQIKQSTRRYAKRQISWFNQDSRIKWLDPLKDKPLLDAVKTLIGSTL